MAGLPEQTPDFSAKGVRVFTIQPAGEGFPLGRVRGQLIDAAEGVAAEGELDLAKTGVGFPERGEGG